MGGEREKCFASVVFLLFFATAQVTGCQDGQTRDLICTGGESGDVMIKGFKSRGSNPIFQNGAPKLRCDSSTEKLFPDYRRTTAYDPGNRWYNCSDDQFLTNIKMKFQPEPECIVTTCMRVKDDFHIKRDTCIAKGRSGDGSDLVCDPHTYVVGLKMTENRDAVINCCRIDRK